MNIVKENLEYDNITSGEYHIVIRNASGVLAKYAVVTKNHDNTVSALRGKQRAATDVNRDGSVNASDKVNEDMFGIALKDYKNDEKALILYIGKVNLEKLSYHSDYSKDDVRDGLRKNMIIAQEWYG